MLKAILFFLLCCSFAQAQTRLPVIEVGNPTLRATTRELTLDEIHSSEIQTLIDDMIHTMKKESGVGLAAPQVAQSLRLFVMKSALRVPLTVVINPRVEYVAEGGTQDSHEGCLSIPGQPATVKRHKRLVLSYLNRHGEPIREEVKGFKAIITQHEFDHINGVLIIDHMFKLLDDLAHPVPLM